VALDLIAELEAVVDAFDQGGLEYALCGRLALGLHGYPRATIDIDLLVRAERLVDAIAVVRTVGFDVPARKMTFGIQSGTPREIQRISKLEPETNALLRWTSSSSALHSRKYGQDAPRSTYKGDE